jgi:hypothetical protein
MVMAMRVAQLKDEELAFLIQVGRIIRQCRLANQKAALLDQVLAEYDCQFHGQYPRRHYQARKRNRPYHL